MATRRRRPGEPETVGREFSDDSDVGSPGAAQFSPLTKLPRSTSVHRHFPPLDDVFRDSYTAPRDATANYVSRAPREFRVRSEFGTPPIYAKQKFLQRHPSVVASPMSVRSQRRFNVLGVVDPRKVVFCLRRRVRRAVLHALGVAGRRRSAPGAGGRYHRKESSQWRCE